MTDVPAPYRSGSSSESRVFSTGPDGRLEVPGLPEGTCWIELRKDRASDLGAASAWWLHNVCAVPAGEGPVDLVVARDVAISGRVVTPGGSVVPHAEVVAGRMGKSFIDGEFLPRGRADSEVVTADAEGRFLIPDQRAWRDRGSVHARESGGEEGSVMVRSLRGSDVTGVIVTLGEGAPLGAWPEPSSPFVEEEEGRPRSEPDSKVACDGTVRDADGRPVALATVLVAANWGGDVRVRTTRLKGPVERVTGSTKDLEVRVLEEHSESPFFLGGFLKAGDGAARRNFRLRAEPIGFRARAREASPGKDGRLGIEGTQPGLWRIRVFRESAEIATVGPVLCGETRIGISVD